MAEELKVIGKTKEEKYINLIKQLKYLISKDDNFISLLANVSSAIHYTFNFLWTGFYIVEKDKLILGPFQGPIACTKIDFGKGVCGRAWKEKRSIIVDDVNKFPGHIACSSKSKSEIAIPLIKDNEVIGLIDVDSKNYSMFDKIYEKYLNEIAQIIINLLK